MDDFNEFSLKLLIETPDKLQNNINSVLFPFFIITSFKSFSLIFWQQIKLLAKDSVDY